MTQLALIRQGGLLEDIDEALRELNRCVGFIGKSGTLTIKISVKPATKNSGSSVIVSDEVNLKTPKLPTAETILFATDDGFCWFEDYDDTVIAWAELPEPYKPEEGIK